MKKKYERLLMIRNRFKYSYNSLVIGIQNFHINGWLSHFEMFIFPDRKYRTLSKLNS